MHELDLTALEEVLAAYKKAFSEFHWEKEKYKWQAVKHFQDHWNIEADDFYGMITEALSETHNLLASSGNFPKDVILKWSKEDPESIREMFRKLFDESSDVIERIKAFKSKADELRERFKKLTRNHFQDENTISTYLWLKFPDKYYIYKYSEARRVAATLKYEYSFKKGAYANNLRHCFKMYEAISRYLVKQKDIYDFVKSHLTEDCYQDPQCITLAIDVGFYISRYYFKKDDDAPQWYPSDYSPELSKEQWIELLQDPEITETSHLEVLKRMKAIGGQATCTQLAEKYGEKKNYYLRHSVSLAQKIYGATGCKLFKDDKGNTLWWPILYQGKGAARQDSGSYIWKLRDELNEALDALNLSNVHLYAPEEEILAFEEGSAADDDPNRKYWWMNASPKIWSLKSMPVGDTQSYTFYNDNGHKRRIFKNFEELKVGDWILGYEATPVKEVVALLEVIEVEPNAKFSFRKKESFLSPISYTFLKEQDELQNMEFFQSWNGSLFKLTKEEFEFIMDQIREENPIPKKQGPVEIYTKHEFLNEVFMPEEKYDELVEVLHNKKNIILQGAPGVGKTFAAKRLAFSMMGEKDEDRVAFVQFHQNYSYEDFVMGYKPTEEGFRLREGIFYSFCQRAQNQSDKDFFFIIDEINRGNLSKIFGELLMLIEKDYRGEKALLTYTPFPFSVPKNVYLIGLMNTADRSLAMIDYALRRRFSFFSMEPGFGTDNFRQYREGLSNELLDEVIRRVQELNEAICRDSSLGKGFCIGHSYFCNRTSESCDERWLRQVVVYDILPTLEEYWFDNETEYQRWADILTAPFKRA